MDKVISSPIRWTGSKKKLLNEMLYTFDKEKDIYIEPFLGSGTVLINVLNKKIYKKHYVNDINSSLIDFYKALKEDCEGLAEYIIEICLEYNTLDTTEEKSDFYYLMRERYNEELLDMYQKSSVFWFLMKAGYNGVYRINLNGKFNVPFGKKNTIFFDLDKAKNISILIQPVEFYCMSYHDFFNTVSNKADLNNSFIYCDPPYIPETKSMQHQVLYTKNRFDHSEFILQVLVMLESYCGFSFMISMSDSPRTDELYNVWGLNKISICDIIRNVNPKKKLISKEIAFLNYVISAEQIKMDALEKLNSYN
ncbi:Dam family site-specific DNA-(adenine-N6)-methyltransferase [Listeria rocourtiae]|uniref:DNA adenine methylase n=1 Tax=Listeria rocourtiae TaxID=647910 RepID=UPI00162321A2|nr:Dam family site-specific DNA-(adenine-N6)-methyltransferase [Listeria rocourtiae]MBC1434886.1 Dam family site-specific DNA-(adenine-N6)-methyltransferase [Listeria rocourtiae]